jgi:DNA-binding NarL/FixJ family response regulator
VKAYRIILADDHPIVRQGIKDLLSENPALKVIAEAADGHEVMELLSKTQPNLILLDIEMPHLGGLKTAHQIKKHYPRVKVLILTMHREDAYLSVARDIGVEGFVLKHDVDEVLLDAIEVVRQGGTFISPLLQSQAADVDAGKT